MFPVCSTSVASRVAFGIELAGKAICFITKKHGFLAVAVGGGDE